MPTESCLLVINADWKRTTMVSAKLRIRLLVIVTLNVSILSGCGIAQVAEFQDMTAEELATKSDEFVCDAGARIEIISTLPVIWMRELKKRDLWSCVSQYRNDGGATQIIIKQQ